MRPSQPSSLEQRRPWRKAHDTFRNQQRQESMQNPHHSHRQQKTSTPTPPPLALRPLIRLIGRVDESVYFNQWFGIRLHKGAPQIISPRVSGGEETTALSSSLLFAFLLLVKIGHPLPCHTFSCSFPTISNCTATTPHLSSSSFPGFPQGGRGGSPDPITGKPCCLKLQSRRSAPASYCLVGIGMSDDIVHEKKTEGQFVLRPGGKKQEDEALLTYVMHTPKLMEMGMRAIVALHPERFCHRRAAFLPTYVHCIVGTCPSLPPYLHSPNLGWLSLYPHPRSYLHARRDEGQGHRRAALRCGI